MSSDALQGSVLEDMDALLLCPPETVTRWGRTLVVAPHPDDETLACGGALSLCSAYGVPVQVLCLTDGTLSHPNSAQYPAPRLKALRENELRGALQALGVGAGSVQFLEYKDRHLPHRGDAGFAEAVVRVQSVLQTWLPQTVLVPWRRDPHPDHRAAWMLVHEAIERMETVSHSEAAHSSSATLVLEYPLWTWAIADKNDAPRPEEASAFRLAIETVQDKKQAAIACHASQVTDLIHDDPQGFRLTPDVLAHFNVPYEVFLEARL